MNDLDYTTELVEETDVRTGKNAKLERRKKTFKILTSGCYKIIWPYNKLLTNLACLCRVYTRHIYLRQINHGVCVP